MLCGNEVPEGLGNNDSRSLKNICVIYELYGEKMGSEGS